MLRTRVVLLLIAVVLVISAAAAIAAPQQVSLEMKGQKGDALTYTTNLSVTADCTITDPTTGMQVLSVNPSLTGALTTISTIDDVYPNGDLSMGGRLESFDIKLDVADLHARVAIVGPGGSAPQLIKLPAIPIKVRVSKRGQPLEIQGLDQLPIPKLPGPTPGQTIDLAGIISDSIKEFSVPAFPDRPVSVGDEWTVEMVMDPMAMMENMGMPMPPEAEQQLADMKIPMKITSKLVGFEQAGGVECAKIVADVPWTLRMPVGPPGSPAGMIDESGTTSAVTWFDYAAGHTVKESTTMTFQMTMSIGDQMPVKMSMNGQVLMELKPS